MIWISSIFRDRADAELINFQISATMFFMTQVDKFLILYSGYSFVLRVSILAYLSFWHCIFRTLLTLDNHIYQTHKRNITQFDLLMQKHLIIQLTKLQIDILNVNATFRHCKKSLNKSECCSKYLRREDSLNSTHLFFTMRLPSGFVFIFFRFRIILRWSYSLRKSSFI